MPRKQSAGWESEAGQGQPIPEARWSCLCSVSQGLLQNAHNRSQNSLRGKEDTIYSSPFDRSSASHLYNCVVTLVINIPSSPNIFGRNSLHSLPLRHQNSQILVYMEILGSFPRHSDFPNIDSKESFSHTFSMLRLQEGQEIYSRDI